MTLQVGQAAVDVVTIARKHAERVDTEGTFPATAVAELRSSALLGLVLPVAASGQGAGPVECVEVMGELAAACGSTAMIYLTHNVALQGAAANGVHLTRETLVPEVTVTAEGNYWHPVAATDERALVTRQIEPLSPVLDEVSTLFAEQWAATSTATSLFPCA